MVGHYGAKCSKTTVLEPLGSWLLRPDVDDNEEAQPLCNLVAHHSEGAQLVFRSVRHRNRIVQFPMNGLCALAARVRPRGTLVESNHVIEPLISELPHVSGYLS